ncbi:hypothetical protein [Desulfosporosinus hippei]|uniref:Uncharacterized protein n=1 Tax=Desulfosporosinus hippei DSM 8344 TaxID=1121419 RepID=A0A1G8LQN1_9FIRM|nr:hypothetical protein [Desulfosporosinus hippei]SDI58008.1 hypothetical protein SAMN05443529_1533 [Desulfosporosinus hippei DSM 8344]
MSIIILGLSSSVYFKNTFINDLNFADKDFNDLNYVYYVDLNNDFDNSITNFNELKEKSQYIISVKVTDEYKTRYSMALKCPVQVMKIFKNDKEKIKEGEIIYIYEPVIVKRKSCYSNSGYVPMKNNEEYILFLKDTLKPDWYDNESKLFIPASIFYGKFNLSIDTQIKKIQSQQSGIPFNKILDYDLILLVNGENIIAPNNKDYSYRVDNIVNIYNKIKEELINCVYYRKGDCL